MPTFTVTVTYALLSHNDVMTLSIYFAAMSLLLAIITSTSANTDGPHDAASHKIDHTEYNYQTMSISW